MKPAIIHSIEDIRRVTAVARSEGRSIGFVPTMGALHEGHLALVRAAKRESSFVVVSIFVNPTQFGPNEDYSRYPRTLDEDQRRLAKTDCDLIFAPSVEAMYPETLTSIEVAKLGDHLCGPKRPGHFRGVCTVVLKLFNIVQPDVGILGAKDAQQARIISRMVRDLNVPTRVVIEPTVRDPDGLAMSSRNRYLSVEERRVAPQIYLALQSIRNRFQSGETNVSRLEAELKSLLLAIPGLTIDYASIVDDETLQPMTSITRPALIAVAVFLGQTRLIDNLELPFSSRP